MGAEGPLDLLSIDHLRARPAFGRVQHDHWPARAFGVAMNAGVLLDLSDLRQRRIKRPRHCLVHALGLVSLDEERGPAIAAQETLQFFAADAREDGWV